MTLRGAEFIFINPFHLISAWPALSAAVILLLGKKVVREVMSVKMWNLPKKGLKELRGSQEMLNAFSFCCVEPRSKRTDFFLLCSAPRISNLQHGCWQRKSQEQGSQLLEMCTQSSIALQFPVSRCYRWRRAGVFLLCIHAIMVISHWES